MTTTSRRPIGVLALVLATSVATVPLSAAAAPITFDVAISQPAAAIPPVDVGPGLALDYETPDDPPDAFYTQGFAFGGRTQGVTAASPTTPGVGIVTDPTVCLLFGTACVANGTRFLAFDIAVSLVRQDFSDFRVESFSASQAYQNPDACPDCNEGLGLQNAAFVRVSGFTLDALVAQQTFALVFGFDTFILDTDPDWVSVDRVVFQPLDASGVAGIADVNPCCTLAIDNISTVAVAVPEPVSILLLVTGLAGFAARRSLRGRNARTFM